MNAHEESWPSGFNDTLSKNVVTLSVIQKALKVGSTPMIDMNIIYSRVLVLQQSSKDIILDKVLQYELAAVPASMFDDKDLMRSPKQNPYRNLQVEMSS